VFDVIDFLESMGQDAQLRYASSEEIAATLAGQPMDSKLRDALLAKDAQRLGVMLGKEPFCCYINPAKEDEGEDDKDDKDEGEEDGKGEGDRGKIKKEPSTNPRE
jgi:hypothetical protein